MSTSGRRLLEGAPPELPLAMSFSGGELSGHARVQGSKHGFAHRLAIAALCDSGVIRGVPTITDSRALVDCIRLVFDDAAVTEDGTLAFANPREVSEVVIEPHLSRRSRNIYCLLPALLLRAEVVTVVEPPSGCEFNHRPFDWYLEVLAEFGVVVQRKGGRSELRWPRRHLGSVKFPYPSMTGTVLALACAAVTSGTSRISVGSTEPSVTDQTEFLKSMDVVCDISGREYVIYGPLNRASNSNTLLRPDQEVAATLICAVALAGGHVRLEGSGPFKMDRFQPIAEHLNLHLTETRNVLGVEKDNEAIGGGQRYLVAGGHPLPSSDWSASVVLALAALPVSPVAWIDIMFPDRLRVLDLLRGCGFEAPPVQLLRHDGRTAARADFGGRTPRRYSGGAFADPRDTRTAAALLLSSIVADGWVILRDRRHLERAYADLPQLLAGLGSFEQSQDEDAIRD